MTHMVGGRNAKDVAATMHGVQLVQAPDGERRAQNGER